MRNTNRPYLLFLDRAQRPLSINEVVEAAQKLVATINIATVYRNTKQLIDSNIVTKISSP